MPTLRFDTITAYENNKVEHPATILERLGIRYTKWEGAPIGDCVFIEVDKIPESLPPYITPSDFVIDDQHRI
jgi:hypothetical protein